MSAIIDFFGFVSSRVINILDSIKFSDSPSLFKYILVAIIIGFIIKLIKGSANEFDHSMNFSTGSVVKSVAAKYQRNKERKEQIVNDKKVQ